MDAITRERIKTHLKNIINYDIFDLPTNEVNEKHYTYFQLRTLYRVMIYVHTLINFPRHFDPDLGEYIIIEGEPYLKLSDVCEVVKGENRQGNCGTYSAVFEAFVEVLGFEVRHVGIIHENKISGHWCSEVKIGDNWAFFDTMYTACPSNEFNILSAMDLIKDYTKFYLAIPPFFNKLREREWKKLFVNLEINNIKSYDDKEFFIKYYGREIE